MPTKPPWLKQYLGKYVKVIDIDGIVYRGYVDVYEQPYDNEDEEESIGIMPSKTARVGWDLSAPEIVSVEVIDEM